MYKKKIIVATNIEFYKNSILSLTKDTKCCVLVTFVNVIPGEVMFSALKLYKLFVSPYLVVGETTFL